LREELGQKHGSIDDVRCPYCGYEGEFGLIKNWRYRWWNAYFYECSQYNTCFACYVVPDVERKGFIAFLMQA
jgi:hypothetical protein